MCIFVWIFRYLLAIGFIFVALNTVCLSQQSVDGTPALQFRLHYNRYTAAWATSIQHGFLVATFGILRTRTACAFVLFFRSNLSCNSFGLLQIESNFLQQIFNVCVTMLSRCFRHARNLFPLNFGRFARSVRTVQGIGMYWMKSHRPPVNLIESIKLCLLSCVHSTHTTWPIYMPIGAIVFQYVTISMRRKI